VAWEACLVGCTPLVLEDLNINFRDPRNKQEELIINLLDDFNIVDKSRRFVPQRPHKQSTRAQWTWRHKREGRMHHSQPDYIFAREGDMRHFRGIGYWWPQYHDLEHRAVVATIQVWKRGKQQLKAYPKKSQEFPMQLPPQELQEDLTTAFAALQATCEEPEVVKRHWHDWVSAGMWLLIKQRTSLHWAGQLRQCRPEHATHHTCGTEGGPHGTHGTGWQFYLC
jgi:hypothetical protein